jgi:hypothetical protein
MNTIFNKKNLLGLLVILFSSLFISCSTEEEEIKEVTDKAAFSNSDLDETTVYIVFDQSIMLSDAVTELENVFEQNYITRRNLESIKYFKSENVYMKDFTKENSDYQTKRNLLFLNIIDSLQQIEIKEDYNSFAKPQYSFSINAPDLKDAKNYIKANKKDILKKFHNHEIKLRAELYASFSTSDEVKTQIQKTQNVKIDFPSAFSIKKNIPGYAFCPNYEGKDLRIGTFIYSYNHQFENDFSVENWKIKRDSVFKANSPQIKNDTVLFVDNEISSPEGEFVELNNIKALNIKGYWEYSATSKGGPFICYVIYDEKQKKYTALEGILYQPDFEMDNAIWLRKIEAIFSTLELKN